MEWEYNGCWIPMLADITDVSAFSIETQFCFIRDLDSFQVFIIKKQTSDVWIKGKKPLANTNRKRKLHQFSPRKDANFFIEFVTNCKLLSVFKFRYNTWILSSSVLTLNYAYIIFELIIAPLLCFTQLYVQTHDYIRFGNSVSLLFHKKVISGRNINK